MYTYIYIYIYIHTYTCICVYSLKWIVIMQADSGVYWIELLLFKQRTRVIIRNLSGWGVYWSELLSCKVPMVRTSSCTRTRWSTRARRRPEAQLSKIMHACNDSRAVVAFIHDIIAELLCHAGLPCSKPQHVLEVTFSEAAFPERFLGCVGTFQEDDCKLWRDSAWTEDWSARILSSQA